MSCASVEEGETNLITCSGEIVIVPLTVASVQPPELPVVRIVYLNCVSVSKVTEGVPVIDKTPPEKPLVTPGGRPSTTRPVAGLTVAPVAPKIS